MVVILYDGYCFKTIEDDAFLVEMYEEFLYTEYGETLDTNEDYIPYEFGELTYIVIKKDEYEEMTEEDLENIMKLLNNG